MGSASRWISYGYPCGVRWVDRKAAASCVCQASCIPALASVLAPGKVEILGALLQRLFWECISGILALSP